MAKAPVDPNETDLEQRILGVLRDAGSPVKTAQLVKECQVPKKKLNQVLYRMKKELHVALVGPTTWCLGDGGSGDAPRTEGAQPGRERPPRDMAAIPEKPDSQLSEQQEKIYRLLEAGGPHKALNIAKSLGMKTAKEVNPDLYDMRRKHFLDLDQNSQTWTVYRPEDSRGRNPSTTIIYQQNPINMISQSGPNSHISIENSEAVQIGHGNVIVRQPDPGENGSSAPHYLPPPAPADPSTQDPLAASWGPQDICMEKSVLRRVQVGHGNEMSLHSTPARSPVYSPFGSPPAFDGTAGSEASFEIRMPTPGPHPEGDTGDVAQRVHISSCFLMEAAIGNNNRMSVGLGAAGPAGGAASGDGSGDNGELAEDTAPQSEAAGSGGKAPCDARQADPDISTFASHLEAVTLESRNPEALEDGP